MFKKFLLCVYGAFSFVTLPQKKIDFGMTKGEKMKTSLIAMVVLLSFVFTAPVLAEEKPAPKLNLSGLAKAAEFTKKNRALFNNPESLKALMRLAQNLKKK